MLCMNKLLYVIMNPFIHKMCLKCYLRYILPSEIESFSKGNIFLATTIMKDLAMIACL